MLNRVSELLKNLIVLSVPLVYFYLYITADKGNSFNTPSDFFNQTLTTISSEIHIRENAAIYTLCRNSDLWDMLETIQNYEDRFNANFHYDWVFLNDVPFDDKFIELASRLVSGTAKFGLIPTEHWGVPSSVDQDLMNSKINQYINDEDGIVPYAGSISYRNMCRFQSGFFYKHELLLDYDFFWRVEPGVKLYCDVDVDIFHEMASNEYKYGFTLSTIEYPKTIPTLFQEFENYLIETNQFDNLITNNSTNYNQFVYDSTKKDYNLCHFWTNFEIGDLNFLRSKEYNDIFQYLDSKNGFYYERWGDAPVRSLILSLLLKKGQIKWFDEIGYLHQPYMQCPSNTDIYKKNRCSCNQEEDFTDNWYSCTWFFNDVLMRS